MVINGVGRKFEIDLLTALKESLALFPVDELKAEQRLIIEKIVARRDVFGQSRTLAIQMYDIPSINPLRKLMEEYWFLASPLLRLAISSALLKKISETLHDNLPVVRAKQLGRSMKKTALCKKATELPG